jgi:HD-GYP domain-containing protein (c-di-GMP phosphodiesterase class II)
VENARLYAELVASYDSTLEALAAALDLRDRETEGHSRRVAEITVRLASILGIEGDELTNILRGSLLHDIGKIGIQDGILLKPGTLTTEERATMQRHPFYAYNLLKPIEYLKPALDIPYCHHEKWDGSGYPRGLKGSEIPIAARIFAVADVWDALLSDRPYRPAWKKSDALAFLREQSGKHFDPQILNEFLSMISQEEIGSQ